MYRVDNTLSIEDDAEWQMALAAQVLGIDLEKMSV